MCYKNRFIPLIVFLFTLFSCDDKLDWVPKPVEKTIETSSLVQRTDFANAPFYSFSSVNFSINGNGYIGTGQMINENGGIYNTNELWQYNPSSDSWTKMANFGGQPRNGAFGFSLNSKGYIGGGFGGNYKDVWEYDPSLNSWTQKKDFSGGVIYNAASFVINNKAYVGTGGVSTNGTRNDFWEYDQENDLWTKRADFGGLARINAIGFSIGSKGYMGFGDDNDDLWEYSPTTNSWTLKGRFDTVKPSRLIGVINDKAFMIDVNGSTVVSYDPSTNTCNEVFESPVLLSIGLTINSTGYVLGWWSTNEYKPNEFYEITLP